MRTEGQKESRKQEDRVAKKFSGSRNAASGAFWSRQGDVRTPELLFEMKWTGKKQLTLKASVLQKIFEEALLAHRTAVLGVHLDGNDYVILEENDFLDLVQRTLQDPNDSGPA